LRSGRGVDRVARSTGSASVARTLDPRRPAAEFLGTGFLVLSVVGSGIMAERLSDDIGIQLLANAFATAGALLALILALGPVSGAHINPAVSVAERLRGGLDDIALAAYVTAQIGGGICGTIAANVMFDLSPISVSGKERAGANLVFSEFVATIGLLIVIYGVVTTAKPTLAAATVAGYIGGAYFFTSSTSFANPAVTIARTLSDTFAGIAPADAPAFVAAQLVAAVVGVALIGWLFAGNQEA